MSKIYDELKRAEYSRHAGAEYSQRAGNVVSAGVCIDGEISGNDDLLVEGLVEGLIELGDGVLTIAPTGRVAADVVAREVIVYGEIRGNIAARDRIEIRKGAVMAGDVMTARMIIEEGADFRGLMEIASRGSAPQAVPATASLPVEEQNTRALSAAG